LPESTLDGFSEGQGSVESGGNEGGGVSEEYQLGPVGGGLESEGRIGGMDEAYETGTDCDSGAEDPLSLEAMLTSDENSECGAEGSGGVSEDHIEPEDPAEAVDAGPEEAMLPVDAGLEDPMLPVDAGPEGAMLSIEPAEPLEFSEPKLSPAESPES
jgi:hypothetical protein